MKIGYKDEGHLYTIDGISAPCVSNILQSVGIVDYSAVPAHILENARLIGHAAHKVTELYDLKTLDDSTVHPKIRPYLDAYVSFLKKYQPEILFIEEPVASKKLWFCGKPDRIYKMAERSVWDIKTTAKLMDSVKYQLAGYKIAHNETHPDMKVKGRYPLLLKPDGTYLPPVEYKDKLDKSGFISALNVFNLKRR